LRYIVPFKTRYYERAQGKIKNAPYEDPSYKWAAAGMVTSAGSCTLWIGHLRPGYLKQESLDQLVPRNLSGVYELSGNNQGKAYTAKLELRPYRQNYQGSISGDFPLLDAAVKNGLPATIRISSDWIKEKNPAIILVSPFVCLRCSYNRPVIIIDIQ
jgi:hypothetical protein